MSEQDWSTKLAPVLSVLDGIRSDAAEALRELIEHWPDLLGTHIYHGEGGRHPVANILSKYVHWDVTPQGHSFWSDVHNDLKDYDETWFDS